jgi:hypothetical protein
MTMKKIELLDPDDCDSTIVAYIKPPRLDKAEEGSWRMDGAGYIKLSDCNRWIRWELFDTYIEPFGYNIAKLDNAINILTEARAHLVKYQKEYLKLDKEMKKHNEAVKKRGKTKRNKPYI